MIKQIDINLILSNPDNPRVIKDEKFKQLVKSLKGFPEMLKIRPIVVDESMMILGGNMRLNACKEVGMKKVWINIVEDWTDRQKKEFIIKDNVGFGEWYWDVLANDWEAQDLSDWGLDVWNVDNDLFDVEENNEDKSPSGSDDNYSVFELIMEHKNKLLLFSVLNDVKKEFNFDKIEQSLIHIINNYKK